MNGISLDWIIFDEWGGNESLLTESELNELQADAVAQDFYEEICDEQNR